jgi:hypothetical protein
LPILTTIAIISTSPLLPFRPWLSTLNAKGIRRYKRDHQEGSRLNSVELFRWVENNFQNDSDVEDHNRFASYLCPSEKLDGRGKMATLQNSEYTYKGLMS